MRKGIVVSSLLHVGFVAVSAASFQLPLSTSVREPQPVTVELASLSDLTRQQAGTQNPKPKLTAKAKKDKPRAKVKKPRAPKFKTAKPKPKAKPAPKRVAMNTARDEAETLLGLKKVAKPAAKSKPKKQTVKKSTNKTKFNPDKIAALLDKAPDNSAKIEDKSSGRRGESDAQNSAMTISEIDALRARISQCWSPPVAGLGAESMSVKLRMRLKPDGSLATAPTLVSTNPSPLFRAAADSAIRAVWQCQPYMLPASKYALWQDMILNFDPREMIGG